MNDFMVRTVRRNGDGWTDDKRFIITAGLGKTKVPLLQQVLRTYGNNLVISYKLDSFRNGIKSAVTKGITNLQL